MKKRKLGNSNLEVSVLGLGCMRMSFGDTPTDKQEMIAFLHKAVEELGRHVIGFPGRNGDWAERAGLGAYGVGLERNVAETVPGREIFGLRNQPGAGGESFPHFVEFVKLYSTFDEPLQFAKRGIFSGDPETVVWVENDVVVEVEVGARHPPIAFR